MPGRNRRTRDIRPKRSNMHGTGQLLSAPHSAKRVVKPPAWIIPGVVPFHECTLPIAVWKHFHLEAVAVVLT